MTTEELKIVVRAEARQAIGELQKVQRTTAGNVSSLKNMAGALVGFGGVAAALVATKRVVFDNIRAGVQYAAALEKQTVAFDVLLGSADKAREMMRDIQEFSASTPFQLPELTNAAQRLLGFGTAAEDVVETMQRLGDLSMGNSETLGRLTLAYGKLQAKGKATLEELNMFTEAGVPLMAALQEQTEATKDELFDMVTKGEIGFEDVNETIRTMTTEGGQFFEMTQRQSETLSGTMSTLKDNIDALRATMLEDGGFVDALKDAVTEMTNMVQQIEEAKKAADLGRNFESNVALVRSEEFKKLSLEEQLATVSAAIGGYEPSKEPSYASNYGIGAYLVHKLLPKKEEESYGNDLDFLRLRERELLQESGVQGAATSATQKIVDLIRGLTGAPGRKFFMPGERGPVIAQAEAIREQLMTSTRIKNVDRVKDRFPAFFEEFRRLYPEARTAIPEAQRARFGGRLPLNEFYGAGFGDQPYTDMYNTWLGSGLGGTPVPTRSLGGGSGLFGYLSGNRMFSTGSATPTIRGASRPGWIENQVQTGMEQRIRDRASLANLGGGLGVRGYLAGNRMFGFGSATPTIRGASRPGWIDNQVQTGIEQFARGSNYMTPGMFAAGESVARTAPATEQELKAHREEMQRVAEEAEKTQAVVDSLQLSLLELGGRELVDAARLFGQTFAETGNLAESAGRSVDAFFESFVNQLPDLLLSAAAMAAGNQLWPLAAGFLAAAVGAGLISGLGSGGSAVDSAPTPAAERGTRPVQINVSGDVYDADRFESSVISIASNLGANV